MFRIDALSPSERGKGGRSAARVSAGWAYGMVSWDNPPFGGRAGWVRTALRMEGKVWNVFRTVYLRLWQTSMLLRREGTGGEAGHSTQ